MEKVTNINNDAPEMKADCCASCPHWFRRVDLSQSGVSVGDCRSRAPIVFMVPGRDALGNQGVGMQTLFPLTDHAAWCGEHPARYAALYKN